MFDHNNAFNEEHMEAVDGGKSLIFQGKSKRDVALYAIKKVKIECLKPVTRDLFINNDMYESFMQRACELGLYKEVKPTFMQKIGVKPFEKYIPISLSTQEYDMWENINRKYQKDIIDSKKEEELNIAKDILEREKETKDNPITHTQAKEQFLQDVKQGEVNINATSSSIILDMKNGTDEECL